MPKHNRALAKEMGERIERQRKLLGLSQENVASMSGLSYQFFSKVERGESSLGADSILSVCGALGLSRTICSPAANPTVAPRAWSGFWKKCPMSNISSCLISSKEF